MGEGSDDGQFLFYPRNGHSRAHSGAHYTGFGEEGRGKIREKMPGRRISGPFCKGERIRK
jgi:hypothetical protein